MRSGSEAGSYLRLIDFVYHSTLGLRVIKKKKVGARHRVAGYACVAALDAVLLLCMKAGAFAMRRPRSEEEGCGPLFRRFLALTLS